MPCFFPVRCAVDIRAGALPGMLRSRSSCPASSRDHSRLTGGRSSPSGIAPSHRAPADLSRVAILPG